MDIHVHIHQNKILFLKYLTSIRYKGHASIKLIKAENNSQVSKFSQIDIKCFQGLDPKKAAQKDDVKTNLLKKNADFFAKYTSIN